jgi:ubiquitin carboxyl-terminal hydrolase 22/27/51
VDPYWDISLELPDDVRNSARRTLEDCLQNYVKQENLGSSAKIRCDNCGTYELSTKQLTLRKLPIVACFHLKRFEHTANNERKKISSRVNFPAYIDLSPYTTACRNEEAEANVASSNQLARLSNKYSLFAVVNHNGTTESGHYSCYVRHQRRQWYKCNDQVISRENAAKVLDSEGYLLFYSKMFIDYE